MKRFAITLAALTVAAGAAVAGDVDNYNLPNTSKAEQTVTVDAGRVLNNRELKRAGLDADTQVTLSDFSVSGTHNTYER